MLKRGTLLLMLSAIALGGAVLLLENQSEPGSVETANSPADVAESEKLLPFEEEDVEQFSVTRAQLDAEAANGESSAEEKDVAKEVLTFVKSDEGTWQMAEPRAARAEGGAIAFLLSQVATPDALPVFVDADNLEEFGLASPESTVSLTANGSGYLLHIGSLDFLGDRRYVQAIEATEDSPNTAAEPANESTDEMLKIYAISGNIINAVNRPTEDWLVIDASEEEPVEEELTAPVEEAPPEEAPPEDGEPDSGA